MSAEQEFPTVDSTAPAEVLVVITDADDRVVHFNPGCERVTGYRQSEVLGLPVHQALPGGTSSRLPSDRLPSSEIRPLHYVGQLRTRSGEMRSVRWTRSRLHTPGGEALNVWTGIDITGTEPAAPAVVEGDARLMAVLEAAVDGIITIDESGIIESINPAGERLFGWSAAELVGQPVTVLMPEPYHSEHDDYLSHYLETGERRIIGIGREVEGRRKDGSVFPMDLAVSEVRLPGRRLFTGIARDISERRRADAEARQRLDELAHASRLADLGELTSSIAHEVNQPLAAIVSFAEACLRMLRSDTGSKEVLRGALEQIVAQGERAGNIVHNLRQFVRKGDSKREMVDVNVVVREVLGLLSNEVRQRGVTLHLALDETLPPVPADRVQVGQVTLNLVRNAIDALPTEAGARREVTVTSVRSGDRVIEVSVTDTGVGLPAEGPHKVFETFYTTKSHGMGIGLSICRSLVEAHGGRLSAESNPTGGATFRFTLPVADSETDAADAG